MLTLERNAEVFTSAPVFVSKRGTISLDADTDFSGTPRESQLGPWSVDVSSGHALRGLGVFAIFVWVGYCGFENKFGLLLLGVRLGHQGEFQRTIEDMSSLFVCLFVIFCRNQCQRKFVYFETN